MSEVRNFSWSLWGKAGIRTAAVIVTLSFIVCVTLSVADPLTPLTHEDTVVIVGFNAALVLTIKALWRLLVKIGKEK